MGRYLLLSLFSLPWCRVLPQTGYQPVDKASAVRFKIKNLGFDVTGSFGGVAGKIVFDPSRPEEAMFDVTVDAGTVNTDNSIRDDHLRGGAFFDVEHYPQIRLVSGKITFHRNGTYLFNGKLLIKGRTKDVWFPFTAAQVEGGGYRFSGVFSINRKDFGIGGFSTISDQTDVSLDVIAK